MLFFRIFVGKNPIELFAHGEVKLVSLLLVIASHKLSVLFDITLSIRTAFDLLSSIKVLTSFLLYFSFAFLA